MILRFLCFFQRGPFSDIRCTIADLVHDRWHQFRGCNINLTWNQQVAEVSLSGYFAQFCKLNCYSQKFFVCQPSKKVWSHVLGEANLRRLSLYNAGACGALYITILFCSLKFKVGFQSWWLEFIWVKNGGELGHDNILAALNDWISCLPFPIPLMVGPLITWAGGGSAWPVIFTNWICLLS